MSVAAPPRVSSSKKSLLSPSNFLGFINVAGAQHFLKLRHEWKTSNQLRLTLGLNYDARNNVTTPWAGLRMLLNTTKEDGWAVEVNTDWAVLCTPKYDLMAPLTDKFSLPVDLRIGKDFYNNNQPHVEVGLHNPKVALALLVTALVTKQPINVKRKEIGGFTVGIPVKFKNGSTVDHTLNTNAEIDATLQRTDHGLNLHFQQLSALLRLRQD